MEVSAAFAGRLGVSPRLTHGRTDWVLMGAAKSADGERRTGRSRQDALRSVGSIRGQIRGFRGEVDGTGTDVLSTWRS